MLPWWFPNLRRPLSGLLLSKALVILFFKEVYIKLTKYRRRLNHPGEVGLKVQKTGAFLSSMWEYNRFAVEHCRQTLLHLSEQKITKVSVYGVNEIAAILYGLSYEFPVQVTTIYDECPRWKPWAPPVLPLNDYQNSPELLIIAAVVGVEEKVKRLSQLGINVENLVLMGRSHKGLSHSFQSLQFTSDSRDSH